jgi:hypothetical protein
MGKKKANAPEPEPEAASEAEPELETDQKPEAEPAEHLAAADGAPEKKGALHAPPVEEIADAAAAPAAGEDEVTG